MTEVTTKPQIVIFILLVVMILSPFLNNLSKAKLREPPKGQRIPWRLHVGTFWKLPFIRHPKRLGVSL